LEAGRQLLAKKGGLSGTWQVIAFFVFGILNLQNQGCLLSA
jgi:hypothetical protein